MTRDRNEQKHEYGKTTFKVVFAKNVDKKTVTMKEVPHEYSAGKWSKLLVVDVQQAVDNEYVADVEVASGSPVQIVGVPAIAARRTGEMEEEH